MRPTIATITANDKSKVESATMGLNPSYFQRLSSCNAKHIPVICDYISALRSEIKFSDNYRKSILITLMVLSRTSKKDFKDFTRDDVITYFGQFRKEDSEDPTHKWIGTYNANLVNIIRFFRWLYYPKIEPTQRPKPEVVQNLRKLKRREISKYKPNDMWDVEDNRIFLKYCPNPRDRCYHAMECDLGARPHEILNLRIKDIEFKQEGGKRYAIIVVNGKTGERSLPLIESIPYITEWISNHPQESNRDAFLFLNTKTDKAIEISAIFTMYKRYKEHFKSLLSSEISEDDKRKIRELLKKPWNPYVHRHSALTEKYGLLNSDINLRQFAGWSTSSNMHRRYVHLSGGESMKCLLKVKGIVNDEKQVNMLESKTCPSCGESNRPNAQFCFRCNSAISLEAYQKIEEERQKKDQELYELKDLVFKMGDAMKRHENSIHFLSNELNKYRDQFGSRSLTDKERGKLREMKAAIEALPPEADEYIPEYDD
jgi:integrase/recombinase XerD